LPPKRLRLYATLQTIALVGCWAFFMALWVVALTYYDMGDIEFWGLVVIACMGVYGLRPNLERAIDTAWLQGVKTTQGLADRIAQLKPVKRRIDIVFSISVVVIFILGLIAWSVLVAFSVFGGGFTM